MPNATEAVDLLDLRLTNLLGAARLQRPRYSSRPTIRTSYHISTSPLRRNFDRESVQRAGKQDLTGQARVDLTII